MTETPGEPPVRLITAQTTDLALDTYLNALGHLAQTVDAAFQTQGCLPHTPIKFDPTLGLATPAPAETETTVARFDTAIRIELQAAQMAECYYRQSSSNHYRRGSGLPRGYSVLPHRLQQYWQRQCQIETAVQQLQHWEHPQWQSADETRTPRSSQQQQLRATVQKVFDQVQKNARDA